MHFDTASLKEQTERSSVVEKGACEIDSHSLPPESHEFHSTARQKGIQRVLLLVIGVMTIVNGLVHVFLVPPWQHYDEPGHFEYVWLLLNRLRLPEPREFDQSMRRDVLGSMVEFDFFEQLSESPNFLTDAQPLWLPYPQTTDPPFYYLLVAPGVYPFRHTDVVTQLYLARLVSLALYLLTVWIGCQIVAELVSDTHPLRIAVPGMMALLPAYVDLMTAVNNDVGATFVFTVFLWGGVQWMLRGASIGRLLWITVTAGLCVWTKSTAAIAVPLWGGLILMTPLRGFRSRRRLAWVGTVGVIAVLVGLFNWGDAATWYRFTEQDRPLRQYIDNAPLGGHALALEGSASIPNPRVVSFLLPEQVDTLRGQPVSLGVWMWASQPIQVRSPEVAGYWTFVEIDTTPKFVAFSLDVPLDVTWLAISLRPFNGQSLEEPVTVYYDAMVLAIGERPLHDPPQFDNEMGTTGIWGGTPFVNFVRNPSIEKGWPWLRPGAARVLRKFVHVPANVFQVVEAVLDWERTKVIYPITARRLFDTFWAAFQWGGLMLDQWWYQLLAAVTAFGLFGGGVRMLRLFRKKQSPGVYGALFFLGGAMLLSWGLVFLRPFPAFPWGKPFIPVARYAYPSIVPTVLVLAAGWTVWPRRSFQWVSLGILFAGLVLLNWASLERMAAVFYP